MAYVTRFSGGAESNSSGRIVLHIRDKDLRRSVTSHRGMRECMFCAMLVSALLIACLIAVTATSNLDTQLPVDGMGSNGVEPLFIRREILESLRRNNQANFLQNQDQHGIVGCIANVESLLVPWGSEEKETQGDPHDLSHVMIQRRLIVILQKLGLDQGEDPSTQSKSNNTVLSYENENPLLLPIPYEELVENAPNDLSKREIVDGMRKDLSMNYPGIVSMVENSDSTAYEQSYPPALQNVKQLLVLKNEVHDKSTEREKELGRENSPPQALPFKKETVLPPNNVDDGKDNGSLHKRLVPNQAVGGRNPLNDRHESEGNEKGQYVDATFQRLPSENEVKQPNLLMRFIETGGALRDIQAADKGEKTTLMSEQRREGHAKGSGAEPKLPAALSLWRRPVALCALSMAALLILALLASVRGYGAASWRRARIPRPGRTRQGARASAVDDDDELLVPNGGSAPLWAKYLGRCSSPEPTATHEPRSAFRVVRDAVRAYARRSRSRRRFGGHLPTAPDVGGDVPPLGTVHV